VGFLTDFYAMVAQWAAWAEDVVEGWPDAPRDAVVDRAELEQSVRIAERVGAPERSSGG